MFNIQYSMFNIQCSMFNIQYSMFNLVKGRVRVWPYYLLTPLLLLVSCQDKDDVEEEFVDWQATNVSYFNALAAETQAKVAAQDASWALIPSVLKPAVGYQYKTTDYIVVQKLENGAGTTSPLHTDSVEVHYQGWLLPSRHYPTGMMFDYSYEGAFDPVVASPVAFYTGGVVEGFQTALQHMHRGDHWKVYIPYQLGYKESESGSIPGYSTLIFELRLEDFWKKEKGDRQ